MVLKVLDITSPKKKNSSIDRVSMELTLVSVLNDIIEGHETYYPKPLIKSHVFVFFFFYFRFTLGQLT